MIGYIVAIMLFFSLSMAASKGNVLYFNLFYWEEDAVIPLSKDVFEEEVGQAIEYYHPVDKTFYIKAAAGTASYFRDVTDRSTGNSVENQKVEFDYAELGVAAKVGSWNNSASGMTFELNYMKPVNAWSLTNEAVGSNIVTNNVAIELKNSVTFAAYINVCGDFLCASLGVMSHRYHSEALPISVRIGRHW